MKDYAAIAFAGHLGLTERASMIASAFNESAENAKDYEAFKEKQDTRASVAMTKAIVIGQSRLSRDLQEINDLIAHSGGALTPAETAAQREKLKKLRSQHFSEKSDIERLKPETDSMSQLFTILASAEDKMNGFDPEIARHTRDAKGNLTQFNGQLAADEIGNNMQARTIEAIEGMLAQIEKDNAAAAVKTEYREYLQAGLTVPAPTPAPATARFKRKS